MGAANSLAKPMPPVTAPPATAGIRACTPDDLPAVAAMFQRTFRKDGAAAPASLAPYLADVFFRHPWFDPAVASRVHVSSDGVINGFIGVLPLHMRLNDRPLRAAVAGSLMVDNPEQDPLAGARLLRSFIGGPQDLSLSESANPLSQAMWEKLGGKPVPAYSMEWVRVLRPGGTARAVLRDHAPVTASLLAPFYGIADRVAPRIAHDLLRIDAPTRPFVRAADVGDDDLIAAIPRLAQAYALRPDWDAASLRFALAHAAPKTRYGNFFRRMVYGRGDEPIGCYLYHGRPGGLAMVLQLLARPDALGCVIDSLFAHAHAQGCVAVRGRTQPELLDALMRRRSVFLHRSSTVMHTRDAEVLAAIRSGDALLVGLAAESWTRLIGDAFN